ncbi:GTP 3',8-cyclase MoaA [Thermodesulfobacteriota bacterium]
MPRNKAPKKRPESLHIYISNTCNLRCVYCLPEEGNTPIDPDEALRPEELTRVLRVATREGISSVELLGGEPLMRKGLFPFYDEAVKMEDLRQFMITTNGVLLEDSLPELVKAGVRSLTVCIDTLNPAKYQKLTRGDFLYRVMEGLKQAEKVGMLPIRINVLIIKDFNEDEIIDFAMLTKDHPYIIKFIGYQPAPSRKSEEQEIGPISAAEIRENMSGFQRLIPMKFKGTNKIVCYRFQDALGRIEFFDADEEHQCGECTRVGLTVDGQLQSCLLGEGKVDLKEILREGGDDYEIVKAIRKAFRYKPKKPPAGTRMFKRCTWIGM